MKTKLTIMVDDEILSLAKQAAREKGVSLSRFIEGALRQLAVGNGPRFSEEWKGKFRPADRDNPRYRALTKKYL